MTNVKCPCQVQLDAFCGEFIQQDRGFKSRFEDEFWRLFSRINSQAQSRILINPYGSDAAAVRHQTIRNLSACDRPRMTKLFKLPQPHAERSQVSFWGTFFWFALLFLVIVTALIWVGVML